MPETMQLNYKLYSTLKKLCKGGNEFINPWFKTSYPAFVNKPISTLEDLIPIIAFAYSWMPTIPTIQFDQLANDDALLSELKALQKGDTQQLENILHKMIPAINNSLVGVSKILHFIAPDHIAIIDSRVLRAWKKHIGFSDVSFPYTFTKNNIPASIDCYVNYNNLMNMWLEDIKQSEKECTLRNLELMLYSLGRK